MHFGLLGKGKRRGLSSETLIDGRGEKKRMLITEDIDGRGKRGGGTPQGTVAPRKGGEKEGKKDYACA